MGGTRLAEACEAGYGNRGCEGCGRGKVAVLGGLCWRQGRWRSILGVTCLRPHIPSLSCPFPSLTEKNQSREAVV